MSISARLRIFCLAVIFLADGERAGAETPRVDVVKPRPLSEVLAASAVIVDAWLAEAEPDPFNVGGNVVAARVKRSFKGSSAGATIYFHCSRGCELGAEYILFLIDGNKKLGDQSVGHRQPPASRYPADAEYYLPALDADELFPVVYNNQIHIPGQMVLYSSHVSLPPILQQGKLPCERNFGKTAWVDFEALAFYVSTLVTEPAATARP